MLIIHRKVLIQKVGLGLWMVKVLELWCNLWKTWKSLWMDSVPAEFSRFHWQSRTEFWLLLRKTFALTLPLRHWNYFLRFRENVIKSSITCDPGRNVPLLSLWQHTFWYALKEFFLQGPARILPLTWTTTSPTLIPHNQKFYLSDDRFESSGFNKSELAFHDFISPGWCNLELTFSTLPYGYSRDEN